MFIVDAHLDLAMNALEWNRDYRQSIDEIRSRERHLTDKKDRGNGVVSFEELRNGNIGLVVATVLARYVDKTNPLPGWNSPEQAWAHVQGMIAWYNTMQRQGYLTQIHDLSSLDAHLQHWEKASGKEKPIGYILSLEGADSIVDISYVEHLYQQGLRAIGPAHFGRGRYAQGTNASGPLTPGGRNLLKEMERLSIILDASHLSDESFWDALNHFNGHVWASHTNCRAIVNHNRQFSDEQIRELIQRNAVIGVVMEASMMIPNFIPWQSDPLKEGCVLERLVDHLDHICQIAGNVNHVAIGSDLDGGFGRERSPADLETIADIQKLQGILGKRGYQENDIANIMHGNWLSFLRRAWKK